MPTVWFLTEKYRPEERSTAYILTQIAEHLAKSREVGVITGPATQEGEVVEAPRHAIRGRVSIYRGPGTDFSEDSLLGQGVNWVTRTVPMILQAFRRVKAKDVVIVVTNPPILPYLALLVQKVTGCSLVLLVHDVYPEVLAATGVLGRDSPLVRVWHRASEMLYRRVDRIITLGRDMSRLITKKIITSSSPGSTKDVFENEVIDKVGGDYERLEKVKCIPNWAEIDIVYPQPRGNNSVLKEKDIEDKFVVLYAGNHGRTHDIESLAEVARRLDVHGREVHFLFVGFGAKREWLRNYSSSYALENVTIVNGITRSEQNVYLNACDLAVISFIPGMAGISVPSRTYNHMAAGKPILAVSDEESELAYVVQEENIGWWVPPGNSEAIIEAIMHASKHPEEVQKKGKRAAEVAQTKYSFKNVIKKYESVIEEVT